METRKRNPIGAHKTGSIIASKTFHKSYKSIAIQTDNLTNNESTNSKSISSNKSSTDSRIIFKNSDNRTSKPPKIPNSLNPATLKQTMQKKPVQSTSCYKQLNTQNSKPAIKKSNTKNAAKNPTKKVKKQIAGPTTRQKYKVRFNLRHKCTVPLPNSF